MTNEELERMMNFIIERQERTVAQQAEHDERITRFERSYVEIAELLKAHDAQLVGVTTNGNAISTAVESLAAIAVRHDETVKRHDEQIAEMRESINRLTRAVERYITARGNNGQG